jgi:hypothetical protein
MLNRLRYSMYYIFSRQSKGVKQFLLFVLGVALIAGFFLLPPNRVWLKDRIFAYYRDFGWQKNKMGIEQRMADRFLGSYTYSKQISNFFEQKKIKPIATVLIPPTDYFTLHGIDYHVPEPLVFYYYTGLHTVWPNSPYAQNAHWYVHVTNKKIIIDSITNRAAYSDTLKALNKFNIRL